MSANENRWGWKPRGNSRGSAAIGAPCDSRRPVSQIPPWRMGCGFAQMALSGNATCLISFQNVFSQQSIEHRVMERMRVSCAILSAAQTFWSCAETCSNPGWKTKKPVCCTGRLICDWKLGLQASDEILRGLRGFQQRCFLRQAVWMAGVLGGCLQVRERNILHLKAIMRRNGKALGQKDEIQLVCGQSFDQIIIGFTQQAQGKAGFGAGIRSQCV